MACLLLNFQWIGGNHDGKTPIRQLMKEKDQNNKHS